MITLYQFSTSPFSEKVRRALNYKGLDYKLFEVPRAEVANYAHVSPSGKFPAIEHDGTAVLDSTDILRYLDVTFPEKPLIPKGAREAAFAHILEDWADESLYFYEMTMRIAWSHNNAAVIDEFVASMPGITAEQARPMIEKAVGDVVAAQGLGRKPQEMVVQDCERHFEAIDKLLAEGPWLVGSDVSIADLAVAAQLNALLYASEAQAALSRSSNIADWLERLEAIAPKEGK